MLQAGSNEDASVDLRSIHSAALAAMATALFLGGCSADDASGWFSKPVDLFGRRGGYNFSQLGGAKQERPVTANDLVDASGACATAPAPEAQAAAANPGQSAPGAPDEAAQLRGGVAVGMSECDVIARVGRPAAVNIGNNQNGERHKKTAFETHECVDHTIPIFDLQSRALLDVDSSRKHPCFPAEWGFKTTRRVPSWKRDSWRGKGR